jgi:DNA (cytosine-5)-methyltransferase 1
MADANASDRHRRSGAVQMGRKRFARETEDYGNVRGIEWSVEPDVGRVAHGVPNRVDRLGALGNAVVPQIPEVIGEAIGRAFFNE